MQLTAEKTLYKQIKSPLNYIGGKQKILPQLLPLFPKEIHNFVDLFTGGCNVGVNVNAEKIYCNDNLVFLIEMYKMFQLMGAKSILAHIESKIQEYELSLSNEEGYKKFREHYNNYKNPLDLFVLIAYSFNHQIRFNNSHEFNNPFGRERSSFNATMKINLEKFVAKLQQSHIEFSCVDFDKFNLSFLTSNDFVYCDPPYLITTGTYNDGKRGFTGWNEVQEHKLLQILDNLHHNNIKFALSNVLEHKGKTNDILTNWLKTNKNYIVNPIQNDYANANYQTLIRDKEASVEVLITNYEPAKPEKTPTLFD